MAQFSVAFKGPPIGNPLSISEFKVGSNATNASVTSFRLPLAVTGTPTISDALDTGTLTADDAGITPTTRIWRIVGGAEQGSAATLSASGLGGKWIEYSPDNGTTWSPPVMVYSTTMMGMTMEASHLVDDAAVVALVPHVDATHIAVADGDWSSPSTWSPAEVPGNGARPLIPHQKTVTYDLNAPATRIDRIRVDGTLTWALDQTTHMLVETIVGTRGSNFIIGSSSTRLPVAYTATITFSGRDYSKKGCVPTDLDLARDPRLWGRGLICQGGRSIWGREVTAWAKANEEVDAGATSVTFDEAPIGWRVGDEIIIGGTVAPYEASDPAPAFEDEYRKITSITNSGKTINWSGGLTYDHKNQLAGSTRKDLTPVVALRGGRNVILTSEVTEPKCRRGHTVDMHHMSQPDVWHMQTINMGRTDKSIPAGVFVNDGADFKYVPREGGGSVTEALTATSNVQSRYDFHAHHCGFGHATPADRPIYHGNYSEGNPGHAYVHHGADADFFENVAHKFFGCGMVSEDANEQGAWVRNCMIGSSFYEKGAGLLSEPKNLEGDAGRAGDVFKFGYGYGFRGRAMRTNGNVDCSVTYGSVFAHRESGVLTSPQDLDRQYLDMKDVGIPSTNQNIDKFDFVNYPIVHFAENESIATILGVFVFKANPLQWHDVSIRFKNLKLWGWRTTGIWAEYIGNYNFDGVDSVGSGGDNSAMIFGSNAHNSGSVRCRGENGTGFKPVSYSGSETIGKHDDHDNTNNPRYYGNANDTSNPDAQTDVTEQYRVGKPDGATKDGEGVFKYNADWQDDAIDYTLDPSETFPLVLGTVPSNGSVTNTFTSNADGKKIDNLSSLQNIAPKAFGDVVWTDDSGGGVTGSRLRAWAVDRGRWQYNDGSGLANHLVVTYVLSDRLTGRPAKVTKLWRFTGNTGNSTNNGVYTYSTTPVTGADITVSCAKNGSVVIDTLDSVGGGNGTYALDIRDHLKPDFGVAALDGGTGEITYKPDRNRVGTDEMFVFVESGGQYRTRRISILVGSAGSAVAPAATTHFTVADGGSSTIDVSLLDPPDTGKRKIRTVQFSTDGGSTWRRLCHKWPKAVHTLKVESNGTLLTPGSYNLRIRYKHDHEEAWTAASADLAVTVT